MIVIQARTRGRLQSIRLFSITCGVAAQRRTLSTSQTRWQTAHDLSRTRNIGIIAHIDAGKTTTTERMLYYAGFTRRIGERARGITIQSAAITFYWPPADAGGSIAKEAQKDTEVVVRRQDQHTVNLIDTPGHADFTFEVIRSLRILDGAICILDGVAGVEAQTEKVWHQASGYNIPRLIYVNKLDRDGAAFERTVREVATRLHTWPLLCQIPYWREGKFVGVGDVVNFELLSWADAATDGRSFAVVGRHDLSKQDAGFYKELKKARIAMIEALTEHDEILVEQFLDSNEDWEGFSGSLLTESIRRVLLSGSQKVTPVHAGASFRNIGVQPLLDAVNCLLPSPLESQDPNISLGDQEIGLNQFLTSSEALTVNGAASAMTTKRSKKDAKSPGQHLEACALAFKVVHDAKRGVLVYVRVYSGSLQRNALLHNTSLNITERSPRLLKMYANDAVEVQSIEAGQIGVIAGLKHARTGDTLLVYSGPTPKGRLPAPVDKLQLKPIVVPPPLFFTSVEPNSLAEERNLKETLAVLLREDPSLTVRLDDESGQTQLAGMGELHLEIARDRLLNDLRVKATTGKIEISYRETLATTSETVSETFDRDVAGSRAHAECTASVEPFAEAPVESDHRRVVDLGEDNWLVVQHPTIDTDGRSTDPDHPSSLPPGLSLTSVVDALKTGTGAALARGPSHAYPLHSTVITIDLQPSRDISSSTTPAALVSASRLAVSAALKSAASQQGNIIMEPVMLVTIAVPESHMGSVVHDLSSSRGGSILSLDDDGDTAEADAADHQRLSPAQLARVYTPPDPFGDVSVTSDAGQVNRQRQIQARVPLKEMVGYLKHLRSLTAGRGTFVMAVDRFERMNALRTKALLAELGGGF